MNRFWLRYAQFLSVTTLLTLSTVAGAQTTVPSGTSGGTWTLAGSPYIITTPIFITGTLTIEPGVVVEFQNTSSAGLNVEGTLDAQGTADAPIVFRHMSEEPGAWSGISFDEGSHGTLSHVQIYHSFRGIYLYQPAGSSYVLDNLTIAEYTENGLYAFSRTTSSANQIHVTNATIIGPGRDVDDSIGIRLSDTDLLLENSLITNVETGVDAQRYSEVTAVGTIFSEQVYGLYVHNSDITTGSDVLTTVDHCTFYDISNYAIHSQGSESSYDNNMAISNTIFDHTSYVVHAHYYVGDPYATRGYIDEWTIENCNYTGSLVSSSYIRDPQVNSGNVRYSSLLANPDGDPATRTRGDYAPTHRSPARRLDLTDPSATIGAVPYAGDLTGPGAHGYWYEGDHVFEMGSVVDLPGDMVVFPGVTVTFEPGVTVRVAAGSDAMLGGLGSNDVEIVVHGTLEADGTISTPVVFTSAAETPAPGDWYGIVIPSDAETFNVSQVALSYATRGVSLEESNHIVADSTISHCSDAGIFINGGAPDVVEMNLQNNDEGIRIESSDVDVEDTVIGNSGQYGLFISDTDARITDTQIYGGEEDGILFGNAGDDTKDLILNHVTVADNGAYGIHVDIVELSNYTLSMSESSVTHNGTDGIYIDVEGGEYICSYSNLWGNGSDTWQVPDSDTCFSVNPLYANMDAGDLEPTKHSPNRALGEDGDYVGALPYNGAPSPHIEGYLWDGYDFTEEDSPYTVRGDIVVPEGVSVTFEAGATLEIAALSDEMGGGEDAADAQKIAFLFEEGASFEFETAGETIMFTSDADNPAPGDWFGLRVFNGGDQTIANIEVEYGTSGLYVEGPSAPAVVDSIFYYNALFGIEADGVNASMEPPSMDILAAWIIGPGTGDGVHLVDTNANVRSSYITHTTNGIYNTATDSPYSLWAINNTIVHQHDGINTTSSVNGGVTAYIDNNIIAESTGDAVNTSSADVFLHNNNLFQVATISGNVNSEEGTLTSDPLIEDDDWDDAPRWWDGKLFFESPAINSGYGDAPHLPTRDILGNSRDIGGEGVDIGAFEHDPMSNEEPRADDVFGELLVATGEPFELDGSAAYDPDGTITSAWWTMSDDTITSGQTVAHTFAEAGTNQWAYLTVVDNDGAEDHALKVINVNDRPVAEAGLSVFGDVGETVYFDGTESYDPDGSIVSWVWDFGDGSPPETELTLSPSWSYSSAGLYLVELTVTDNEGFSHSDTTVAEILGTTDTVGPLIQHTEIPDGQIAGQDLVIAATIRDASDINVAYIWYRELGSTGTGGYAQMIVAGDDLFEGTIPGADVTTPGVEYWFQAVDDLGNTSTEPLGAPDADAYSFLVTGNTTGPAIVHTEIADDQAEGESVPVTATVTDASGVGTVTLHYRSVGDGVFGQATMSLITQDTYTALIPAYLVTPTGVEYYIEAEDAESVPNVSTLPTKAPGDLFDFTVAGIDDSMPLLTHTPISSGQPVDQAVTVNAEIADSDGIALATLFYRISGSEEWTQTAMSNVGGTSWSGDIPSSSVTEAGVDYYLVATDNAGYSASDPSTAPTGYHTFAVSTEDLAGPSISHTPISDGQIVGVGVIVSAAVIDPSEVSSVTLHYRTENLFIWQSATMTLQGDSTYQATIPAGMVNENIDVYYYLSAIDGEENTSLAPASAPAEYHRFSTSVVDVIGPIIDHTPVADGQVQGSDVVVSANVTDVSSVSEATVYYRVSGSADWTELAMSSSTGDTYTATIPGSAVTTAGVDYTVEAVDDSSGANVSADPADAPTTYHSFSVSSADLAGPSITHTPSDNIQYGDDLVITVGVTDPAGVSGVTLYLALADGSFAANGMAETDTDGVFSITISASSIPNGTTHLRYYIEAVDALSNTSYEPEDGSASPQDVTIVYPDVTPPTVTVQPITEAQIAGNAVIVSVNAEDDGNEVTTVIVYYRTTGETAYASVIAEGPAPSFTATIPGIAVHVPGIEVYAEATDSQGNTGASDQIAATVDPAPDLTPPTISVSAISNGQAAGTAVTVQASVVDDSGIGSATLYYRVTGDDSYLNVAMANGDGDIYTAEIPGSAVVEPSMEFYVVAADDATAGNSATAPATAPEVPLSFTVTATDTAGPSILHVPETAYSVNELLDVTATVSDPSGISSVVVYWRTQGESEFVGVTMSETSGVYAATIGPVAAPAIEYYIEATDAGENSAVAPVDASATPFAVNAVVPDISAPEISHTEITDGQESGFPLSVSAIITDDSSVEWATVHYRALDSNDAFAASVMTNDTGNSWSGVIPASAIQSSGVEYYIEAADSVGNVATIPEDAPTILLNFSVGETTETGGDTDTDTSVSTDTGIESDVADDTDTGMGTDTDSSMPDSDVSSDTQTGDAVSTDTGVGTGAETGVASDVDTSSETVDNSQTDTATNADSDTQTTGDEPPSDTGLSTATDGMSDSDTMYDTEWDAGIEDDGKSDDGCSCSTVGRKQGYLHTLFRLVRILF